MLMHFGLLQCTNILKNVLLSNLLNMSIPDEGHSMNSSCALNLISTFYLIFSIKFGGTKYFSEKSMLCFTRGMS
jgi:hypothetical protein